MFLLEVAIMNSEFNFTVMTKDLQKALNVAVKNIRVKPTVPMLANIHFIAKDDKVEIQAVEATESIAVIIDAEISISGEFVVDAKLITNIIDHIEEESVLISKEKDKGNLQIQSGWNITNINIVPVLEYPRFPEAEAEKTVSINKEDLDKMINKTVFACSTDTTRPIFTGAYINFSDGEVMIAASDSRVLAISKKDSENKVAGLSAIIPAKVLNNVQSIDGKKKDIDISFTDSRVIFTCNKTRIVSNIINGNYPNVNQVIPKDWVTVVNVDREKFLKAVERVKVFGENDLKAITLDIQNEQIFLTTNSEKGMGHEAVPAIVTGEPVKIAFNIRYLNNVLRKMPTNNITMRVKSSVSPTLITENEDEETKYIISPIRVA